jgi:hypothetical protein
MSAEGSVAGLRIESDFDLHSLAAGYARDPDLGCVAIRRVTCEELMRRASADSRAIRMSPGQPGAFLVTAANEILAAPTEQATDRSILSFLFGPCFGAIAYLNHVLPLHASAIETTYGCVSFIGRSGAGKSTMVAALSKRGHTIHSDDVCMLRTMSNGELMSWPGIRWIRLTDDAALALDYVQATAPRTGRKHTLMLERGRLPVAPSIPRAIYALEESAEEEVSSITRLRGARAAERIIANAYRPQLAHEIGAWPWAVACCVAIADRVPVFLLRRPRDFTRLAATLDLLEAHIAAQVGGFGDEREY